ncbi:MAG: hypothetical protein HF978_21805 [Desulfobacteraceae bacterium]|nr:hypothetical protein [Desulfobacteraceae bacterium]MBC2758183.1 hypothetical protein [Desulfobacteraceae bacterium]
MVRQIILTLMVTIALSTMVWVNAFAAANEISGEAFIDAVFENNNLDMAAKILVDDNVPTSAIIKKAKSLGYANIKIVDALADTKLSHEQVIISALRNRIPADAIFNSTKICGPGGYTPDSILRFLVEKELSLVIIIATCKSMINQGSTKYNVIYNLCMTDADTLTIEEVSTQLDVPPATTLKACPRHAEYGHAYISHDLPQEAHIITGVSHLTLDDNTVRGFISDDDAGGVGAEGDIISPKRP